MADEPDVSEVRPPTVDDLRRICRAPEDSGGRYLLIGGFAVIPSDAADRAWLEAQLDEEA